MKKIKSVFFMGIFVSLLGVFSNAVSVDGAEEEKLKSTIQSYEEYLAEAKEELEGIEESQELKDLKPLLEQREKASEELRRVSGEFNILNSVGPNQNWKHDLHRRKDRALRALKASSEKIFSVDRNGLIQQEYDQLKQKKESLQAQIAIYQRQIDLLRIKQQQARLQREIEKISIPEFKIPQIVQKGVYEHRKPIIAGALVAAALGYLYKKAPQWMKNRVKDVLHEHGMTVSDVTPAELDLLMAATYAQFNPLASFRFKRAAARMSVDQEVSKKVWPVLYQLYYGTKKPTRSQKKKLKQIYKEAHQIPMGVK